MGTNRRIIRAHPKGEQPIVEPPVAGPAAADTFAGRVLWNGTTAAGDAVRAAAVFHRVR